MSILNHKKLKKLLFALFIIGVFCFSFTDFSCAKTEQEWLSEINYLLTEPKENSDLPKDKQEWLSELEQVAKEETEKRAVEIECLKNPETCPVALESLLIDKKGNIEGVEEFDLQFEHASLFENFTQKLKQALVSLGFVVENGIAQVKELMAEKITATERIVAPVGQFEKIEMRDKLTNEIYCTWIENNEWIKVKGECGMFGVKPQSIPPTEPESEELLTPAEPEVLTEPEPPVEEEPSVEAEELPVEEPAVEPVIEEPIEELTEEPIIEEEIIIEE